MGRMCLKEMILPIVDNVSTYMRQIAMNLQKVRVTQNINQFKKDILQAMSSSFSFKHTCQ